MAAEHAVENASKPVRVVPTVSLQGGLAAMVAFDGALSAEENAEAMAEAAEDVATGAVIGTVDGAAADSTVHEGAVYIHQGRSYVVAELTEEAAIAVERGAVGYRTRARERSCSASGNRPRRVRILARW